MDMEIARIIDEDSPKFNPLIAEGLAVEQMKHAEEYIHQVMQVAMRGAPDGLIYTGLVRCAPEEEKMVTLRKRGGRRHFDIAPSYFYTVKLMFEYQGKPIAPRYMLLPYVGDAGHILINGSRFFVVPVLSDPAMSVGVSDIFIRLLVARLIFRRKSHSYRINGVRTDIQVATSMIHNKTEEMKAMRSTVKCECALTHYLFCKYGFTETMQKYGGCTPIVGHDEINSEAYPESEWVICSSIQLKPITLVAKEYTPTEIRIAVKKEDFTPLVKQLIGGFFYVVDHIPERMEPEFVNSTTLWRVLMGYIIWSNEVSDLWIGDKMEAHIRSLDEYLDVIFLKKFRETGMKVDNIYDLFVVIVENFNNWLLSEKDKVASMYNKELSILYYVLYNLTSAIVRLSFKLRAMQNSARGCTEREIESVLQTFLRTDEIRGMANGRREVTSLMYSGDNKLIKITSQIVPQHAAGEHGARTKYASFNDASLQLHASLAEIGGPYNPTDAGPDGRFRINPFAKVNANGAIERNPKFAAFLDEIQEKYFRR